MDAREIAALFRAWIWVILVTVGLAGFAALVVSIRMAPTYQATSAVLVGPPLSTARIGYTDLLTAQNLAQTYAEVAVTTPVLAAAAKEVGIPADQNDLIDRVTAHNAPASSVVTITAQASSADQAARIANAVATELVKQGPPQDTEEGVDAAYLKALDDNATAIAAAQKERDDLPAVASPSAAQIARKAALDAQLATLRSERTTLLQSAPPAQANALTVIEPATPPKSSTGPRLVTNVLLGAIIGLVVALAMVILVENLGRDPRRRRGSDPGPVSEGPAPAR